MSGKAVVTVAEPRPDRTGTGPSRPAAKRVGWIAVAVWAAGVAAAFAVGWWRRQAGLATEDPLPPLFAHARFLSWQVLPAAGVAAFSVAALPTLTRRFAWRATLLVTWATAALWAVTLAASDGLDALTRPLKAPTEYLAGLPQLSPDPLSWLATFSDRLGGYTTQVRGHPPLPMLVLWLLQQAGLGGAGWAAVLLIGSGSSAVIAIAVTVRRLAGERVARTTLPFLALAPPALWVATTMDAFFLAAGAWGTALLAMAASRKSRLGGVPAAVLGGILLGALPYLSYGLLPLYAVPLAVVVLSRPRLRVLAALACGLVVVPALLTVGGFWWLDGVRATHATYLISRGSARRSFAYYAFADFAVLGLLTGPAVAHALPATLHTIWRSPRALISGIRAPDPIPGSMTDGPAERPILPVALLVGAALLGTLALDLSGVTKGEVERIWIPYAVWIIPAAALHRPPARGWLAAQALTALALQALVLSPW
ncbi:glycosyltransferase family 39 protein [Actinomadura meridiana]|uniref:Glycosyltransferase family 39 protein n=1 Tax=Actinomadura meridiana TaxID=559626 RepID=A0ABP8BW47_9ACTN